MEGRIALDAVLPHLDERERLVLRLRFVEDMTQSQIAERIGHSQMHVSRILRHALSRIRDRISEQDWKRMTRYSPSSLSSTARESASFSSEPPMSGTSRLLTDATARPCLHRPQPEVDADVVLLQPQAHAAVGEALGCRGGDPVGDQDRVGDSLDGKVTARCQGADYSRQDRPEQLGAVDDQLGADLRDRLHFDGAAVAVAAPQRYPYGDLGPPVDPPRDREAAGERRDQREPEPQALAAGVRLGAYPHALVADDDGEPGVVGLGFDAERAGLAPVGVEGDVHAGLGDDGLQIGQPRFVHADLLGQTGQSVPDQSDVLRPRRQDQLQFLWPFGAYRSVCDALHPYRRRCLPRSLSIV